jgi:Sec-independent protein translocase protein TatA
MLSKLIRKEPTTIRTVAEALAGLNKALDDLQEVKRLQQEEADKQKQVAADALKAEQEAMQEVEKASKVLAKMQDLLCVGQ